MPPCWRWKARRSVLGPDLAWLWHLPREGWGAEGESVISAPRYPGNLGDLAALNSLCWRMAGGDSNTLVTANYLCSPDSETGLPWPLPLTQLLLSPAEGHPRRSWGAEADRKLRGHPRADAEAAGVLWGVGASPLMACPQPLYWASGEIERWSST